MLRGLIVVPTYLFLMFLIPKTPIWDAMSEMLQNHSFSVMTNLAFWGVLAIVAGVFGLLIEFYWKPNTHYNLDSLWIILLMGCLGLLFTGAFQIYYFYETGEFSTLVLFTAPIFIFAEILSETVHWMKDKANRKKFQLPRSPYE